MTVTIGRRELLVAFGGAAAAWPLAARAQQAAMPVVGFLSSLGQYDRRNLIDAFRRGLSEAGYVEGRNVAIEFYFAESQYDRLPALAADLVGRKVAVIAATGGGASVLAAKASTTAIPMATRSRRATSPASTGRAATSRGSAGSMPCSAVRRWGCCTSLFPMLLSSP